MQHTITLQKKSEVEIDATLSWQEFEPHTKQAARLISEEINIEGFRKGKAPYAMVAKRVGEAAILERAAELAVRKSYPAVLEKIYNEWGQEKKAFSPIGRPEVTVTKLAPGNEFSYKAKTALLPRVTLPDYKTIAERTRKEKKEVSVEDKEVEDTLNWIRESRGTLAAVERPAKKDDTVEIDFETRHGGVRLEGGESKNHPLVIGKGKFIPGFEDQLVGMSTGEEKTFTLDVPKDWHDKNLSGKSLEFKVTMRLIQERKLPELTDEFVKNLGSFNTLEALKSNIREGILQEKTEKENQRIRALTIEEIANAAEMEIPDVLIHAEIEKMLQELKSGVGDMGMRFDKYLEHVKKTLEELKKEWMGEAEKRVRIALVLREIAEKESINPEEHEVEERANQFLQRFRSVKDAEKNIDANELREYTRGVLRNEKVFEFLETSE